MAKAKLDASWNEASGIAEVVPDAIMHHDVDRVAYGDEQIDGVSKLQLPSLKTCLESLNPHEYFPPQLHLRCLLDYSSSTKILN